MSGVTKAVVRRRIAELLAVDETAALREIAVPTLVLSATRDRVVSRAATERLMRGLGHAERVEIDGPHLLLQTRSAECAAVVRGFMDGIEKAGPALAGPVIKPTR
jgi:pimeloyl-ACP methyl ester carboxylesterase